VRDYFKSQNKEILVDTIEGKTTNLTGRVAHYLAGENRKKTEDPHEIVSILLGAFIDARLFGSSFAFGEEKGAPKGGTQSEAAKTDETGEEEAVDSGEEITESSETVEQADQKKDKKKAGGKKDKPIKSKLITASASIDGVKQPIQWAKPKTLTGAVQIQHGEVKHAAREVDIYGTSVFGSAEKKTQGTFTSYFGLRYAMIAFHGVANEHSAKLSQMTDADYNDLLRALWYGVRSAANTRTKRGQVPHLLLSVEYQPGEEFQFGRLSDYVKLLPRNGKAELEWAAPEDYVVDLSVLLERLAVQMPRIARIRYCVSPDVALSSPPNSDEWNKHVYCGVEDLAFDKPSTKERGE